MDAKNDIESREENSLLDLYSEVAETGIERKTRSRKDLRKEPGAENSFFFF